MFYLSAWYLCINAVQHPFLLCVDCTHCLIQRAIGTNGKTPTNSEGEVFIGSSFLQQHKNVQGPVFVGASIFFPKWCSVYLGLSPALLDISDKTPIDVNGSGPFNGTQRMCWVGINTAVILEMVNM